MRSALRNVLTATGLTVAAVLPSVLPAQQGGMTLPPMEDNLTLPMAPGGGNVITMRVSPSGVMSPITGTQDETQATPVDPIQKLLAREGDSKHPVVVIDGVRASEDDLIGFSQSLRSGKVRIKRGGVRSIAGDSKEAEKYGTKADDRVILISTEPAGATAPAADSGAAEP